MNAAQKFKRLHIDLLTEVGCIMDQVQLGFMQPKELVQAQNLITIMLRSLADKDPGAIVYKPPLKVVK
jgi:hypothetical protein